MKYAGALFIVCSALFAQTPTPAVEGATVSGIVRDAASGNAIAGAEVTLTTGAPLVNGVMRQSKDMKDRKATSDSQGRFSFSDLLPGEAGLAVRVAPMLFPAGYQRLTLRAGQNVTHDLTVSVPGRISGKVLDEDGEPVPQVTVLLAGREYHAGAIRTLFKQMTKTNDQGEYTVENVGAGRAYMLLAMERTLKLANLSPSPADPKMRRRVFAPTFYPNSRDINGAAPVTLISGEHREAVNIKIAKAPAFCVEATLETAGAPGPLRWQIAPEQPAFGNGASGGLHAMKPGSTAGPDGKTRICDLAPGAYRLEAEDWRSTPVALGSTFITISDRDVSGIKVEALPAQPISGEMAWDGKPRTEPVEGTISFALMPFSPAYQGSRTNGSAALPSTFQLPAVPEGEYAIFPMSLPKGLYIRDITYAGNSVQGGTIRVGSAIGNAGIRVLVADGAGDIEAKVSSQDGKAAAGVNVVAMRADAASEAAVAASFVRSTTDQEGRCTLFNIAPGKYHVLAVEQDIDMTPELVSRMWQARVTQGAEVVLPAGGSVVAETKVASLR